MLYLYGISHGLTLFLNAANYMIIESINKVWTWICLTKSWMPHMPQIPTTNIHNEWSIRKLWGKKTFIFVYKWAYSKLHLLLSWNHIHKWFMNFLEVLILVLILKSINVILHFLIYKSIWSIFSSLEKPFVKTGHVLLHNQL